MDIYTFVNQNFVNFQCWKQTIFHLDEAAPYREINCKILFFFLFFLVYSLTSNY